MRRLLIIFFLGFFLSVFIYPSAVIHPATTLPDNNDTRLIAYIIGQVQNNLLHRQPLFYGTFFAPYENSLTYSDLFLTTAILTLPFRALTSSPIIIFNLAYLINSSLTFAVAFLFFAYLTKSNRRGLLASLIFFLSGYHLIYLPHLQVYSLWAVFLALYFFLRRFYFLFFLAVTLQMAESLFPVYLIFFATAIFYFHQPISLKTLFIRALPFVPIWIYLLFPYLSLHFSLPEATRPIRDAAHFSLGLEEVFTKYRSWTIIILLLLSLRGPSPKRSDLLTLATGLILSLGPVVKLFGQTVKVFGLPLPLPYTLFYYFFPGFQGLRTPSRFIVLALIAASAIIATRLPRVALAKWGLPLLLSLLLLEAGLPRPGYAVDATPPPIYAEVKKLPANSVILELPIFLWTGPGHEIESVRSLYSLDHGHRRIGGYSGFAPLAWIDLVGQITTTGLDPAAIARLKSLGVTHLIENNRLQPLQ